MLLLHGTINVELALCNIVVRFYPRASKARLGSSPNPMEDLGNTHLLSLFTQTIDSFRSRRAKCTGQGKSSLASKF